MRQERALQVTLLAEYRLLHETPAQSKKRLAESKRKEAKRRMERYHG